MSEDKKVKIGLGDKPNLKALAESDPAAFREILTASLKLAEEAADRSREIPWEKLPGMLHPELTFEGLLIGVMDGLLSAKELHGDMYEILKADLHPLSLLKPQRVGGSIKYNHWRDHFAMPSNASVGPEAIADILRKLLYYARFIKIEDFGQAFIGKQMEVHKALPELSAEKLPFVPALRYQQANHGDLNVGRFWTEIGAFYGGIKDHPGPECPACHDIELKRLGAFQVCPTCNLGIKIREWEEDGGE